MALLYIWEFSEVLTHSDTLMVGKALSTIGGIQWRNTVCSIAHRRDLFNHCRTPFNAPGKDEPNKSFTLS